MNGNVNTTRSCRFKVFINITLIAQSTDSSYIVQLLSMSSLCSSLKHGRMTVSYASCELLPPLDLLLAKDFTLNNSLVLCFLPLHIVFIVGADMWLN